MAKSTNPSEEPKWTEKPLKGREFVQVQYLGEEQLLMAFRTAPRFHQDYPALRLVDMILDNSVAGLINLNLVNQQKVRQLVAFPLTSTIMELTTLWALPRMGKALKR